jgi:hypothetical protein
VPQLPAVRPRLGKLQAASPLLVVRRRSATKGVPRERKYVFHANMLPLSVGGSRKTSSRKLSGLQTSKEEMQKKKSQRTSRTTTGSVFSSNLTTPGMSFTAALRGKTEEQQQPRTNQVAGPDRMEHRVPAASPQHEQQKQVSQLRPQM